MTLYELRIRRKAYHLKELDQERKMHWTAWLHCIVQGKRKSGKKVKPVYETFKQFFDFEKAMNEVTGKRDKEKETTKGIIEILKNQKRRDQDGKL